MTHTSEESLSKVLFSAKVLPTLLLIVLPFGIGIILPNLSPIFYVDQNDSRTGDECVVCINLS
jgi:hypothetical protein